MTIWTVGVPPGVPPEYGSETVQPVMIAPDALADGVPGRPLFVSPDHGVFLDGVLVPAKELLNWTTIRQDNTAMEVEYYHLELAQHDIIFAENVPAECGERVLKASSFLRLISPSNLGKTLVSQEALLQCRSRTVSFSQEPSPTSDRTSTARAATC